MKSILETNRGGGLVYPNLPFSKKKLIHLEIWIYIHNFVIEINDIINF